MFQGVSTDKASPGNGMLIQRMLDANMHLSRRGGGGKGGQAPAPPRRMFLDMQAINEQELGTGGAWRGYALLPCGLVFMVVDSAASALSLHPKWFGQNRLMT
jgi:hypothetical protein